MDRLKKIVCDSEEKIAVWAEKISDYIFNNPEISEQEYKSSAYLVKKLSELGFRVTYPYLGFETAFRAEYGADDGKTVAFLAEYDALPGYGEKNDIPAHACGHNWIAGSTLAAAAALAGVGDLYKGKVVVIGTPAEETAGRKVNMADMGAFTGIDAVLQMHLGSSNCVDTTAMAMTDYVFEFYGRAAHAAKEPESGVNALDACNLTIAGINAMRQQFGTEVKIHETIINGGGAPNIIPEYASMWIFVRATSKDVLERAAERVVNIGKGAELMTGARLEYKRADNTYFDIKHDEKLDEFMKSNLEILGITELTHGDKYHSESTDIGNVSYICPTCYTVLSTAHISNAGIHEQGFVKVACSDEAKKLLHIAAKAMAMTALDVFLSS